MQAREAANDPKLSDLGVRRGTCMVGGKAAAEAGAVTHGAVRCAVDENTRRAGGGVLWCDAEKAGGTVRVRRPVLARGVKRS